MDGVASCPPRSLAAPRTAPEWGGKSRNGSSGRSPGLWEPKCTVSRHCLCTVGSWRVLVSDYHHPGAPQVLAWVLMWGPWCCHQTSVYAAVLADRVPGMSRKGPSLSLASVRPDSRTGHGSRGTQGKLMLYWEEIIPGAQTATVEISALGPDHCSSHWAFRHSAQTYLWV